MTNAVEAVIPSIAPPMGGEFAFPEVREGDNKWANSVLARRPGDGSLIWAYQFTPHDNWDFDSTGAMYVWVIRSCQQSRSSSKKHQA